MDQVDLEHPCHREDDGHGAQEQRDARKIVSSSGSMREPLRLGRAGLALMVSMVSWR